MAGTVSEFWAMVACWPVASNGIRATGTVRVTLAEPEPITITDEDVVTLAPAENGSCATTPLIGEVMVAAARLSCAWVSDNCDCTTAAWAEATLVPDDAADPAAALDRADAAEPPEPAADPAVFTAAAVRPVPALVPEPDPAADEEPVGTVHWLADEPEPTVMACWAAWEKAVEAAEKAVSACWKAWTAVRQALIWAAVGAGADESSVDDTTAASATT